MIERDRDPDELQKGEMPFLDHLEELRWRLIKSMIAIAVGVGLGYAVVTNYDVIAFLTRPIDPYLPAGKKLLFTHPMEPFMITLKLALVAGVVFAVPIVLYQAWAFLRPALYRRERRVVVPIGLAAVAMFLIGAAAGFFIVTPLAIKMIWGFQTGSLAPMITAEEYFGFTFAVIVSFGAVFELPLIALGLIYLRILTSAFLRRHRRTFIVVNSIASAILTPGDLVVMTLIVMIPVQLFYELAVVMALIMERRRARAEQQKEADGDPAGVAAAGGA
ncbi:MAG: twin-arginine translocase subunit TatC [Gemmatimonadales bacterium]